MDKGIRSGVNFKFNEMLPQLATIGGKAFRKEILYWAVENYGITIASACTHYNHSFQNAKKATPELVKGLGRPDDKNNGGRKKKVAVVDAAPANFFPVGGFLLLAGPEGTLISQGVKENTSTQTVTVNPPAGDDLTPDAVTQTEFKVCKKSDGTVVCEGLSFEEARDLVAKAKAAKKAALYYV
jgi:hypothetical protein